MLNEAAETKAWWNGFDDAGVHHLILVEATIQSAMDSTKQQLQEAETALEKIKDSERQGVSELEIKAAFLLLKMLDFFLKIFVGVVTCDENIITSNMRNQMNSPCLLQSSGECSDWNSSGDAIRGEGEEKGPILENIKQTMDLR